METLLQREGIHGKILLIDLALSPKHDVYQKSMVDLVRHWLVSGAVAGVLLAPPCETWSAARELATEEGYSPRPLRNKEDLIGLAGLTADEVQQLSVANFLLYYALLVFLLCLGTGTPAIVEHPREPRPAHCASIWRLPWVTHLRQHRQVQRHLLWQAAYGAVSAKPTHMMTCHLPKFKAVLRRFAQPIAWETLEELKGRSATGGWNTAKGKAYPSALNLALATAHLETMKDRESAIFVEPSLLQAISTDFDNLYAGDVDLNVQMMQPDFHRIDRLQAMD
eukprot:Skav215567  [mRNA]  locus=scaffold2748:1695:2534:- [translate_table: standard]